MSGIQSRINSMRSPANSSTNKNVIDVIKDNVEKISHEITKSIRDFLDENLNISSFKGKNHGKIADSLFTSLNDI